jgi:Bacterial regulatory proteins, luxR family
MALVVTGVLNKQVAAELGTSEITIKVHRARIMNKMKAESLADKTSFYLFRDGASGSVMHHRCCEWLSQAQGWNEVRKGGRCLTRLLSRMNRMF